MKFQLLAMLITLSGVTAGSGILITTALAQSSEAQSENQEIYVGPGCNPSSSTAYSFFERDDITIPRGRVISHLFNWEEASGKGYCNRAHYLTEIERDIIGIQRSIESILASKQVIPAPQIPGMFVTGPGRGISALRYPAVWSFQVPEASDVAIAVYIPADDYQRTVNYLRIPPITVDREVTYTVEIRSTTESKNCLYKTVDQNEYQDTFVELGSCQVNASEIVDVYLRFNDDYNYERYIQRIVGDVVRFTPSSTQAQPSTSNR